MFDMMPWRKRTGSEMIGLREEIDNLFNRFFDFPVSREQTKGGPWMPRIDVSESETEITVKAELPGCKAEDIDVKLEGRILTVKGEKHREEEKKEENFRRVERVYGYFNRSLELPAEVDADHVEAAYKSGVLKLTFKKIGTPAGKKIEIK